MEYIKRNKILLSLFILFFVLFVVSTVLVSYGLYSDTPNEFFRDFHHIISNKSNPLSILSVDLYDMPRYCSWVLHRLIYILFFPFYSKTTLENLNLYIVSLLLMPIFFIFINFLLAKRTKRFDIAVFSFAFYSLFSIQYITWFCRELQIAVLIQFLFLQCFLSKHKSTKMDIFIYIILLLSLFQSFENMIIIGFVFFIYGVICYFKKNEHKIKNLITGIISLFIALFIVYKDMMTLIANNNFYVSSYKNVFPWAMYLNSFPDTLFQTPIIISYVAILIIIIFSTKQREFNKHDFLWCIPIILSIVIFLFYHTKLTPNPPAESNLFLCSIFMLPIVFVIILIYDYSKKSFKKEFLNNIFIVSCIVAIFQFAWQINSSFYFFKYKKVLEYAIETTDKPFIHLHFDKSSKLYNFEAHSSYFLRTLFLIKNKNINTVFIPDIKHRDASENDFFEFRDTYFDEKNNALILAGQYIQIETKYWDMTPIASEFKELNINNPQKKYRSTEFLEILKNNNKLYVLNIE